MPVARMSNVKRDNPADSGNDDDVPRRRPAPAPAAAVAVSPVSSRSTAPVESRIAHVARFGAALNVQLIGTPALERMPTGGAKRCASAANTAGVAWRNGATLSSTQKPRPCDEITRSLASTIRSEIGVSGMLSFRLCQFAPSSYVMYTPCCVAAYSSPLRAGSSRTACT